MTNLVFNSNYLYIILPPTARSVVMKRPDEIYTLRCTYACWPVIDLYKEWGIYDFPESTAVWATSFLPYPSRRSFDGEADARIRDEEMSWIRLYPLTTTLDAIDVLNINDADYQFFGVATKQEEADPLFSTSDPYKKEAFLTVKIKNITRIETDDSNNEEEFTACLVIQGEPFARWTKAKIKPVI